MRADRRGRGRAMTDVMGAVRPSRVEDVGEAAGRPSPWTSASEGSAVMRRYVILRREEDRTSRRRGPGPMAESLARPKVTVERVNDRGAAELASDPSVEVAAPTMPTGLIRPLAATGAEADT